MLSAWARRARPRPPWSRRLRRKGRDKPVPYGRSAPAAFRPRTRRGDRPYAVHCASAPRPRGRNSHGTKPLVATRCRRRRPCRGDPCGRPRRANAERRFTGVPHDGAAVTPRERGQSPKFPVQATRMRPVNGDGGTPMKDSDSVRRRNIHSTATPEAALARERTVDTAQRSRHPDHGDARVGTVPDRACRRTRCQQPNETPTANQMTGRGIGRAYVGSTRWEGADRSSPLRHDTVFAEGILRTTSRYALPGTHGRQARPRGLGRPASISPIEPEYACAARCQSASSSVHAERRNRLRMS